MLHKLAARVLLMICETSDVIVTNPTLLAECVEYVLRKMPPQLRTSMAFNVQLEVMCILYEGANIDFGNAPEFPPAPVDNYGAHFGL